MGFARLPLARMPGLAFWKLLGSGTGEGFTPIPDTSVYAILCAWSDSEAAAAGHAAPVFRRYAARAAETCRLTLHTVSARGRWSGRSPFLPDDVARAGPIAALTRATLRPGRALRFWRHGPAISARIGLDPAVRLKIGLGELPYFRQATFSIWPDAASMTRFARTAGPHAAAIRAVREERLFAEELYARFHVAAAEGSWHGRPAAEVLA
jgi:spheroidene monooxygenase